MWETWFIIAGLILLTKTDFCYSKRPCPDPSPLKNGASYGSCRIEEVFVPSYKEVKQLVGKYAGYDNVMILGVSSLSAMGLLKKIKAVGNEKVIWNDMYLSILVYYALEVVSGAMTIAIEDYCQRNGPMPYTFV